MTTTQLTIQDTPPEVTIDWQLIVEAETLCSGANIHAVKSLLHGYQLAADLIREGKDDGRLAAKMEEYAEDLRFAIRENRKVRKPR